MQALCQRLPGATTADLPFFQPLSRLTIAREQVVGAETVPAWCKLARHQASEQIHGNVRKRINKDAPIATAMNGATRLAANCNAGIDEREPALQNAQRQSNAVSNPNAPAMNVIWDGARSIMTLE